MRNLLATVMDYEVNMRKDKRYITKKPVFAIGDSVMVAEHNMPNHWRPAKIISYDDEDGSSRIYHVKLKNGQQVDDIEGHQVVLEKEYFISKHVNESVWKGVQRVVDKNSSDQWAREVGWYAVRYGVFDESFAQLSDALMAYDLLVIARKKTEVKRVI